MLGGVSIPFFNELTTELLILVILIFLSSAIGVFFIRETKKEEHLRNIYHEIYPEQGLKTDFLLKASKP
jgi:hypothetical protein